MPLVLNGTSGLTYNDSTTQVGGIDLINNTGAGADRSLSMGQTAYVDFTNSTSIPLRIATSNGQVYELLIYNNGGVSTNQPFLLPNNSSSWNVNFFQIYAPSNAASGNASFNFLGETNGFRLTVGGTLLWNSTKVFTNTTYKSTISHGRETNLSVGYQAIITANLTDTTTAYTSLGTISCATAMTGRVYIKRIG